MIANHEYPALLLNADYRPVSVYPLSTLSWQDAVRDTFKKKVNVISEYDVVVRSPSCEIKLPSVVVLMNYVKPEMYAALTRSNLWLRDGGKCVYCKRPLKTQEVTFDHLIPKSKGGMNGWSNFVCSCVPCNTKKADKMPNQCGMVPDPWPYVPTQLDLAKASKRLVKSLPVPKDWIDYMYWEGELEHNDEALYNLKTDYIN